MGYKLVFIDRKPYILFLQILFTDLRVGNKSIFSIAVFSTIAIDILDPQ